MIAAFGLLVSGSQLVQSSGYGQEASSYASGGGTQLAAERGQDCGRLLQALAALGTAPDEIDTVVISHAHWDHAGGASYGAQAERPRVNLGISLKVPAMKINLGRMNMPRISIRAKIKQSHAPKVISVPEMHIDTNSKIPGPQGAQAVGDSYGSSSYGGSSGGGSSYDAGSSSSYGGSSGGSSYGGGSSGGSSYGGGSSAGSSYGGSPAPSYGSSAAPSYGGQAAGGYGASSGPSSYGAQSESYGAAGQGSGYGQSAGGYGQSAAGGYGQGSSGGYAGQAAAGGYEMSAGPAAGGYGTAPSNGAGSGYETGSSYGAGAGCAASYEPDESSYAPAAS